MKAPCVYILASKRNGTLYVGVTTDLVRRVWEHRNSVVAGFTQQYGIKLLVYFEMHQTIADAILREKQIKKWHRAWKVGLIQRDNPAWRDLYPDIVGAAPPNGFPLSRAGEAALPNCARGPDTMRLKEAGFDRLDDEVSGRARGIIALIGATADRSRLIPWGDCCARNQPAKT
jgi:putative endonuclease